MEIMNLPRGCGKTTNIIIEAVKTGCPIITLCRTMKRDIERRAEKITNKKIAVYTVAEFLDDDFSFDEDDDDEKLFEEKSHNGIKIFFLIFGLLVLGAALYFIITRYVL